MEPKKDRISDLQLIFSIGCFIQGSTLLSAFVIRITKQDSWFVVLRGFAVGLAGMSIYIALIKKHPRKTLIQMLEIVFGSIIGKTLSVLYVFYFLLLAALNTRDVGNFVVGFIMPETPMIALLIMFIFVCAWAVRAGVETMVRYSWLFVVVSFIVIIFILLLLMKEMKLDNLLPMFTLPPLKYVQGTHIVAAIPFGEILVFMMMAPFLDNQQKIAKSFLWGFLIGAVTLLTIVVRDVVTLGNLISYATLPSYEVVKLIDVFDILTRMEVLYAIELLILLFFKVSILYFATVLALFQVLRLRCYKPYIFITGVIILSLSMIVFRSPMENAYWGSTAAPAFSSIFQLVIPGAALLTSVLRDMLQKDKDKVERT